MVWGGRRNTRGFNMLSVQDGHIWATRPVRRPTEVFVLPRAFLSEHPPAVTRTGRGPFATVRSGAARGADLPAHVAPRQSARNKPLANLDQRELTFRLRDYLLVLIALLLNPNCRAMGKEPPVIFVQ